MTISKAVLAQWLAHMLALVVAYVAARSGVHLTATASAEVAAVVSAVAGPLAGILVKEAPKAGQLADTELERLLTVVAESGSHPRSGLARPALSTEQAQPNGAVVVGTPDIANP